MDLITLDDWNNNPNIKEFGEPFTNHLFICNLNYVKILCDECEYHRQVIYISAILLNLLFVKKSYLEYDRFIIGTAAVNLACKILNYPKKNPKIIDSYLRIMNKYNIFTVELNENIMQNEEKLKKTIMVNEEKIVRLINGNFNLGKTPFYYLHKYWDILCESILIQKTKK